MLGKFLPPHLGHLFACETAAGMVDAMTVLVCSIDAEPIAGALRYEWMRRLLPGLTVRHMHRDIPQRPEDHSGFWPIWREAIREFHPAPIDLVFGSDGYVFRLAAELNATPVLLDPAREVFPVSGSAIRRDPAANWFYIPLLVRPYFQKRVCLMGPESTGKSRLAALLAARFGGRPVPEYGRTYDAHCRQGRDWSAADFVALARTHVAMRRALAPHAGPVTFEDTDPVQTALWAEYLLRSVPPMLDAVVRDSGLADLYLLLSPDAPWVDDGTRYAGSYLVRQWFFERARERLHDLGAQVAEIGGADWCDREIQAVKRVQAFIQSLVSG
jgi:NadR type nicotinamide-nucleotide adenylyltransferase